MFVWKKNDINHFERVVMTSKRNTIVDILSVLLYYD